MSSEISWQLPAPFVVPWKIGDADIDHYQHVNNVAYIHQLEKLAWAHSNQLGLCFADYQQLDRGMVIQRHEINYHQPSHLGDTLLCATWIVECDSKLSLARQFQYVCAARNVTVFTAKTYFVCVSLSSGAPKRMPKQFVEVYANAVQAPNE